MDYDVIVIGARCAGSPTAMLLARKGYRVLLVDRGTFPSDIMSSHFIHSPGVSRLYKWGLLDRVSRTNSPAVHSTSADFGDFCLKGYPPPAKEGAEAYCVRRRYLDKILVDAAAQAGAEVREGFTVEGLCREGSLVTGILGRTRAGTSVSETARIVIGADGMHSIVARLVQAPEYDVVEPLTCNYYSYWSGLDLDSTELFPREDRFFVAAPTNDGLAIINVLAPRSKFREFRADIEGFFFRTLDLAPDFAERVRAGRREERFIGTADTPNFFRQSHGPGWALAGDAGSLLAQPAVVQFDGYRLSRAILRPGPGQIAQKK